ncbi:hypothetical protein [Streptomyces sp. NRRL S-118]|uniref:hypothetical protein n=1 Tax=Streptomyces sp. NRRL S-118 TaxID=1463881 RepID=UPI000693C505|nr:hypothetical protein [Streptomyces sp. NRRL S-118]
MSGAGNGAPGGRADLLLDAGAVLPPARTAGVPDGTGDGNVDVLTARAYAHPALDGRTVVRLVPEAIGPAEDLSLEYLGFTGGPGPERVGRVRRQALGFPAWALVHDPDNGHHALAVVKEMERLSRLVATRPGLAKEGFEDIGERLDRSVPHFLPTYYEQVARLFLAAESRSYASLFFGKARAAEQRHALAVDEERLREVFLEFAGAGALSGKALREHAKGLAARLSAPEAYEQFRALSLERCAAGLPPYAGMLEDLRRLARAARLDVAAEERSLLAEIIHTGPMSRAAASFWKAALPALSAVAAENRAVRERLLHLMPTAGGDQRAEFETSWLALLDGCGATGLLLDGTVPAAPWLTAWAAHRQRGYGRSTRLAAELALVERLADRLAADGVPVRLLGGGSWRVDADLDLLDLCLARGVPVEPPAPDATTTYLDVAGWLGDEAEGRRDLAALVADERFGPLLRRSVEQLAGDGAESTERLRRVVEHPALETVVADWLTELADGLSRPFGLPELDEQLTRLAPFTSPSVLATAPAAVERIAAVTPADALRRTLRAGILDELGWPALEETLPKLGKVDAQVAGRGRRRPFLAEQWYRTADAWPALVVRNGNEVAAIGPDAALDVRTLTLPVARTNHWDQPTVRFVDGQWLVANGHGNERRAVWSGRPADPFTPSGPLGDHWGAVHTTSLGLPGGGRCYGGRPVHPGDTSFAEERRPVASDGISVWVLHEGNWWEYDPATARRGRAAAPAFFDSALAGASDGQRLLQSYCVLLPAQPGMESSPFGSKDGLLGWWVLHDHEAGTMTACSVDGTRSPAVPAPRARHLYPSKGIPLPPLRLPGGAVLHPRETRQFDPTVDLYDTDGVRVATVRLCDHGDRYAAGMPLVPPLAYWHALRPRDERGSARLREVTGADTEALLAAVAEGTAPAEAVARVLPELTHPGLIAGVAGLVAEAARCGKRLAGVEEKARRREPRQDESPVRHAHDKVLGPVMSELGAGANAYGSYGYYHAQQGRGPHTAVDQLHRVAAVLTAPEGSVPEKVKLPASAVPWLSFTGRGLAALAVRAASPATGEEQRAALLEFLGLAAAVVVGSDPVLVDPRGRLRLVGLRGARPGGTQRLGEVHRSGRRRMLLIACRRQDDQYAFWTALEYDPAAEFGAWDGFTVVDDTVFGRPEDGPLAPALRRTAELVAERGPLPYRPEQVAGFAERVGLGAPAAALVLTGFPGLEGWDRESLLPAELLAPFGAKVREAEAARTALRELSGADRRRFTALLLPEDAEAVPRLWESGFGLDPLAEAWVAARGRRRVAPPELVALAVAETRQARMLDCVLNPEVQPQLTGRTEQRMDAELGRLDPVEPAKLLDGPALSAYLTMLRWLAYRLPFGDPLRAVLPVTLRMLRERLADPGLLLALGVDWDHEGKATALRLREAHGLPATGGATEDGLVEVSDALVLTPMPYGTQWETVWLRPAAVLPGAGEQGGPDHPALTLLAAVSRPSAQLEALRTLLSDGFEELVSADSPAHGPAGAAQHPVNSVPELVDEAAGRLGLSQDAAALYLMLLALPDPTDRKQAQWTGWKPARLKKARAELAATDLVVEAKRARAGRSLFLPGGWLEQKAPLLPLEKWKWELLRWDSYGFVVPDRPVAALYAAAWRRVVDGDVPGYEEFEGRGGGRGRGGRR